MNLTVKDSKGNAIKKNSTIAFSVTRKGKPLLLTGIVKKLTTNSKRAWGGTEVVAELELENGRKKNFKAFKRCMVVK